MCILLLLYLKHDGEIWCPETSNSYIRSIFCDLSVICIQDNELEMCELKQFCIKSALVPSDGAYQEIHHVGLVVPQCFDSVEHIHRALVP